MMKTRREWMQCPTTVEGSPRIWRGRGGYDHPANDVLRERSDCWALVFVGGAGRRSVAMIDAACQRGDTSQLRRQIVRRADRKQNDQHRPASSAFGRVRVVGWKPARKRQGNVLLGHALHVSAAVGYSSVRSVLPHRVRGWRRRERAGMRVHARGWNGMRRWLQAG